MINSNLGSMQFKYDGQGYYRLVGADTWLPFKCYYDLGTGTSFDVTSYDGYENFTADNFTVSAINQATGTGYQGTVGSQNITLTLSHVKSYNKTSGVLTASVHAAANSTFNYDGHVGGVSASVDLPVHAYLIV